MVGAEGGDDLASREELPHGKGTNGARKSALVCIECIQVEGWRWVEIGGPAGLLVGDPDARALIASLERHGLNDQCVKFGAIPWTNNSTDSGVWGA
jgi:hypothetical protein